jgi:hypothetical protein
MENNEQKKVVLRKIPLEIFLDVLMEIYEQGVDYVDIVGIPDEIQDTIGVMFSQDYISPEALDNFIDEENNIDINLSDDQDLNQII